MTPIEQKIQAAIEAGSGQWTSDPKSIEGIPRYVLPLVMAALKPLLDDARELAKWAGNGTGIPAIEFEALYKRILAATDPGPGADSSPFLVDGPATSGSMASVPPGPPYPGQKCSVCKEDIGPQFFCRCNGYGTKLSEQSRQAAAGVPDNDTRTFDQIVSDTYKEDDDAPITLCPRCEGCGVYNFGPCAICNGTGRLGPDGEALAAIPTITGSADAMKTPGPAPLGIGGGTGFVSTHDFLELTNRVAALEKGKVAT